MKILTKLLKHGAFTALSLKIFLSWFIKITSIMNTIFLLIINGKSWAFLSNRFISAPWLLILNSIHTTTAETTYWKFFIGARGAVICPLSKATFLQDLYHIGVKGLHIYQDNHKVAIFLMQFDSLAAQIFKPINVQQNECSFDYTIGQCRAFQRRLEKYWFAAFSLLSLDQCFRLFS